MTELNLIGTTLGRFEILSELGRGGMAVVYQARQSDLDRIVALKILPPGLTHDSSYVARFRQEARSAARLEHPHIMPVYEVGEANGLHYIAMKFIQGRTLKDLLHETGAMPVARAAQILAQVGEALDYAHRHGVIHRDIKPSNIMITDEGWVFLTDFGLARGASTTGGLTMAGTVMGTPEYMSPEQAQGLPNVGPPTDIYALGVVLYELLTGAFPFQADTPMGMLAARLLNPPTPPRDVRADLPTTVEDVVMRALARKPEARFASAADMVAALRQAAGLTQAQAQRPLTPMGGTPAVGATIVVDQPPPPPAPAPPLTPPSSPPYVRPATPTPAPAPRPAWEGALPTQAAPAAPPPAFSSGGVAAPAAPRRPNLGLLIGGGAALLVLVLALVGGMVILGGRRDPGPGPTTPPDPEVASLLREGDGALARDGGMDDAIASYTQAVELAPADVSALSKLALAYNLRGDWPNAESAAERLIDAAGDGESAALGHTLLADALSSQGDLNGALEESRAAVGADDGLALAHAIHSNVLAARAVAARSAAEMDDALGSLDLAVDSLGDETPLIQALTHNALAYTFFQEFSLSGSDDYLKQSEESYQRAVDLQPQLAVFHSQLGYLYSAGDDQESARAQFEQALKVDPAYVAAQAGIGWSYYSEGETGQAEEAWQAAIALNDSDYSAYYGLGRLRFDDGDYAGAIEQLSAAAERNPRGADVLAWLGEARLFAGFEAEDDDAKESLYEEAAEAYSQAITLNDRSAFAHSGLGWILQYQEQYDESVESFEAALALDPNNDETQNGMGWSLFNRGDIEEAEPYFRSAVEIDPEYADAHYGLGRVLEELGRTDEARAAYQRALEIDPDSQRTQEALERIGG